METKKTKKSNAGRKSIDGVKHLWIVPQDIHEVAKEKGIQWLWDAVRFKIKFDKMGGE